MDRIHEIQEVSKDMLFGTSADRDDLIQDLVEQHDYGRDEATEAVNDAVLCGFFECEDNVLTLNEKSQVQEEDVVRPAA